MEYYQFQFNNLAPELQETLTALLADIGFDGFEEQENAWCAFIPVPALQEEALQEITDRFALRPVRTIIPETNWNAVWESGFEPVVITDTKSLKPFIRIHASFHAPDPSIPFDIEITPRMSFGTGHHDTTRLMAGAMSELDIQEKKVLDFGTGTGVLAILAEKMGAGTVLGTDHDQWSIDNATDNFQANHCRRVQWVMADGLKGIAPGFDLILANINRNIILDNAGEIARLLNPGGLVLFSGLLLQDEVYMTSFLQASGWEIREVKKSGNWILIKCSRI